MASPLGGMSVMVFLSGSFARLGIVDDDDDEADDDHHVDDDDEFRWSVMVFPSGM